MVLNNGIFSNFGWTEIIIILAIVAATVGFREFNHIKRIFGHDKKEKKNLHTEE